ncbi:MAG TPA: hypothetical protein VG603_10440, partial [Chitinophagales bacterium]|nr:hypothetical protein [Chitinophagales bacterium]
KVENAEIPAAKAAAADTAEIVAIKLPPPPPVVAEPIKIQLDHRTRKIMALEKNIQQAVENIPAFINDDYAEEVLIYAALKDPDELLKKVNVFKGKAFCKHILELCAVNAPISVKPYLYNPQQPVNYILQYSQNPIVKKIIDINQHIGYQSKPLILLDDIWLGKMQVKEAIDLCNDPTALFNAVVKIISRPKYLAKYSIDREMRDYSLRFIREINDNIATGAPQPFYSVENFNAADLYFLMLYGRDEVFSSTFNGLFNRFMQKLPSEDGEAFLKSVNYNQFRDFISLCSSYGTLDEFLSRFPQESKEKLLTAYISNLETEKDDLTTVVMVAEAISNLTDNRLLTILDQNVKKEYDRVKKANDQIGISIYGILSSMISGNARVDEQWYHGVSQQFRISPVTSLASSSLFDSSGQCIEQMYFYNDDDGRSSFINFMNSYRSQPGWNIEDRNTYVRIYSHTGKDVEILANKPEMDEKGIGAIDAYLKSANLTPTVIVHRGHSFH